MGFIESLGARAVYDAIRKAWSLINFREKRSAFSKNKIWQGQFSQGKGESVETVPITFVFNMKGRVIRASARYRSTTGDRDLDLIGGFHDRQHLFLQYTSSNAEAFHKGFVLFKLSNEGNLLSGRYMGIGIKTEEIVAGEIELHKNA